MREHQVVGRQGFGASKVISKGSLEDLFSFPPVFQDLFAHIDDLRSFQSVMCQSLCPVRRVNEVLLILALSITFKSCVASLSQTTFISFHITYRIYKKTYIYMI